MNDVRLPPEFRQQISIKTLVVSICSGTASIGAVAIFGYIVVKIMGALSVDTLEMAGTIFLFGLIGILLLGITLLCVAFYNKVKAPGLQTTGAMASIERIFGLD